MNPKLLLRIASGLALFHLIAHSFGHSGWKKTPDPIKQEVINQMTTHRFPFMGVDRSMSDYFDGYGYITSIFLLFIAIVLWLVSSALTDRSQLIYRLVLVSAISLFICSLDEFLFFFPFAAGISLLAGILTFISAVRLKESPPLYA